MATATIHRIVLISDLVRKFSKQNVSMPTEQEHHLLQNAAESLLLDFGLLEEVCEDMLTNVMKEHPVSSNYTPRTIFPDRETGKLCIAEIDNFRINITFGIEIIHNASDPLSSLQNLNFDVIINDLYDFFDHFNKCTSFYKTFINDVNSYYQQVLDAELFTETGTRFIFEEFANDVIADFIWLKADLLEAYQMAKKTKLELTHLASANKLGGIYSRVKLLTASVGVHFTTPLLQILGGMNNIVETYYKQVLTYLQQFQVYFDNNQQRFLDKGKAMQMWRIPEAAMDDVNRVRFRLAADEYWQSWPYYMDIGYFTDKQLQNVLTEIELRFFDELEAIITDIETQVASYTADIEYLLTINLYKHLAEYKVLSHVDNDFIMWVVLKYLKHVVLQRRHIGANPL